MASPSSPPVDNKERREFHRILYPIAERPWLFIGRQGYEIVDISSTGMRYQVLNAPLPSLHEQISGVVHFRHGGRHTKIPLTVNGTVVRVQNGEVALRLNQEIPFNILLAEQQYLRTRYPMRFWQDR